VEHLFRQHMCKLPSVLKVPIIEGGHVCKSLMIRKLGSQYFDNNN
jgi:hypothetical protein